MSRLSDDIFRSIHDRDYRIESNHRMAEQKAAIEEMKYEREKAKREGAEKEKREQTTKDNQTTVPPIFQLPPPSKPPIDYNAQPISISQEDLKRMINPPKESPKDDSYFGGTGTLLDFF